MATITEGPFCMPARSLPSSHMRSPSADKATATAASSSSYTSSNPMHRRSSFPTSPSLELDSTGKTSAPSYFYLPPPGIGLQLRGCGEGAEGARGAGGSASFSFDGGPATGAGGAAGVGVVARKGSFGSSTSGSSSAGRTSATSTTATSASSLSSSDAAPSKRPPHQSAPGEDPQLAAARRALWEDVVPEPPAARPEGPKRIPSSAVDDGDSSSSDDDYYSSGDDDEDNPRSLPSHGTLPPLPSILRPSSPRSHSHSSSSSPASSTSVRISEEPPRAFTTFSPSDYERKGAAPVEKLSIREWIELQGVREAVGVWSGRIGKWEAASSEVEEGGGKPRDPMCESISSLASLDLGASAEDAAPRTPTRTCGHLAGVMGVRTVSHNNSPVEQSSSLFD